MTQSYDNHAHRPVLTLAAAVCWIASLTGMVAVWLGKGRWAESLAGLGLLAAVACLISMSRAYTVRLQDRIILLEERLRVQRLLAPELLERWETLGVKQVVALRFAADNEYAVLLERTLAEQLRPDAIKRAVGAWRPDHRRT